MALSLGLDDLEQLHYVDVGNLFEDTELSAAHLDIGFTVELVLVDDLDGYHLAGEFVHC